MQPKAIPGRPSKKRAQVEAGMLPQLQAHNDATLEQHCDLWEQTHGERVSRWTMSRAIKRLGWTRKKQRVLTKALYLAVRAKEAWEQPPPNEPQVKRAKPDACGETESA